MRRIRQAAGLLIALSLILPARSCVHDGAAEIIYPTSGADGIGALLLIIAIYLIPAAVTLTTRFGVALLSIGISAAVSDLFLFAYAGAAFSTSLLVGWYVNASGASAYLAASFVELWRSSRIAATTVLLGSIGCVFGIAHGKEGMVIGAGAGSLAGALASLAVNRHFGGSEGAARSGGSPLRGRS